MADRKVPIASSIETAICPSCDCVHLHLQDRGGDVFAVALLQPEILRSLAADLLEYAAILETASGSPN